MGAPEASLIGGLKGRSDIKWKCVARRDRYGTAVTVDVGVGE